jgi:hypothetical protein
MRGDVRAAGGGPGGGRAWGGGIASGMHGEGPTQGLGARARAKRTKNMSCMVVTLEVSKLTGWLNADAPCRVEGGHVQYGMRCGPGGGRAWGRRRKRRARGKGPTQGLGAS